MRGIHHGPWLIVPILLSAVFAALFFPVVQQHYKFIYSTLFTAAGVCVIWIVYFIRAHIFSRLFANGQKSNGAS